MENDIFHFVYIRLFHLSKLFVDRSCYRKSSKHLKNYIYSEVPSSFLFKLFHQLLICFAVLLILQLSEIWAAALSEKICKEALGEKMFFSFPSSKLKSTWRTFNMKKFSKVFRIPYFTEHLLRMFWCLFSTFNDQKHFQWRRTFVI